MGFMFRDLHVLSYNPSLGGYFLVEFVLLFLKNQQNIKLSSAANCR